METVIVIGAYAAIFIMSIVLHEVAHGYVAYRCGDDTAYLLGRLTLNPIKHVDPIMTILVPAVCLWLKFPLFGGAKPVPVNPYRLRNRVVSERLVSSAGVFVNLLIAWFLAIMLHTLLHFGYYTADSLGTVVLGMGIYTNLLLFVFNLAPIPPLDGSRVLRTFLPGDIRSMFDGLDRWGLLIVVILIQVNIFWDALFRVMLFLWEYLLRFDAVLLLTVLRSFFGMMGR